MSYSALLRWSSFGGCGISLPHTIVTQYEWFMDAAVKEQMALALEKSAVKWTSLNPEQTELCESMARGADLLHRPLFVPFSPFRITPPG